jgi:hypothetical protein
MNAIAKTPKTLRDQIIFGLSVLLFAVLNLVPGLTGSYADAQYGGGGGSCPGSSCTGSGKLCCSIAVGKCDANGNCATITNYYYYK